MTCADAHDRRPRPFLRGGDPWPTSPCDPACIPDVPRWCGMAGATGTVRPKGYPGGECRLDGTTGTVAASGRSACARRNSYGNRSAASVRRRAFAPAPRSWITSPRIGATGRCLWTRGICNRSASGTTTPRQRGNRGISGQNRAGFDAAFLRPRPVRMGAHGRDLNRAWMLLHPPGQ